MLTKASLSPESLAAVMEQSSDCVKLLDRNGRLLWMNPNGQCAMEVDDFSTIEGRDWEALWPSETSDTIRKSYVAAQTGAARFQAFCPTARGTPKWWDVSVSMVRDQAGEPVGYLSVSRDVTQSETDREALRILNAEMRHRLKNSYAMVCSLLQGLARGDQHLGAFASDMQRRITALSAAQSLFDGPEGNGDIAGLLDALVRPFVGICEIALRIEPGLEADRRVIDAIALVVGELVVNSTKHGAIGHGGSLQIDACRAAPSGDIAIGWHEQSRRKVQARAREGGQGLSLIDRIVKARKGTLAIDWREDGLDARLVLNPS